MQVRKILAALLFLAVFSALLPLAGCSGVEERKVPPVEALYEGAKKAIEDEAYDEAEEMVLAIREEYPFSPLAVEAELLAADVMYLKEELEAAASAYQSFEENHPAHQRVPYAIYRRGLSYHGLLETADRDQTPARMMVDVLSRLVRAFPETEHRPDAEAKIAEGRELLAGHELAVAEYYLRAEKFDAAKGRLDGILKNYPETKAAKEADKLSAEIPKP